MKELVCDCSICLYGLVSMNCTKATTLDGLEKGVLQVSGIADKNIRRGHRERKMDIDL